MAIFSPVRQGQLRQVSAMGWLFIWLMSSFAVTGQSPLSPRESSQFWVRRGQNLMQAGQYAEAYTAFQLARSLGAPDMAAQMERAKKRNINNILFRALVAEARAQAPTDPTQSLRLLEYARSRFPDSTSLLRVIGDIANQPDNWYYTLRADSIRASPRFSYLLADTDKSRLYYRQGDSLTLIHTFAERPSLRVFSHDDQFLFISTGKAQHGYVYALQARTVRLIRQFSDTITNVHFSRPRRNATSRDGTTNGEFSPAQSRYFRYYLLLEKRGSETQLYDLLSPSPKPDLSFSERLGNCTFSPNGDYLVSSTGLWQLTRSGVRWLTTLSLPTLPPLTVNYVRFSGDNRHLLVAEDVSTIGVEEDGVLYATLAFYELGGTAINTGNVNQQLFSPRKLWRPFSPNGRYFLTYNERYSLDSNFFFFDDSRWQPVQISGQEQLNRGGFMPCNSRPTIITCSRWTGQPKQSWLAAYGG